MCAYSRARPTSSGRTNEHSRRRTRARRISGAASKISSPQSPGIGEQRNLLAARDLDALAPQRGDLLPAVPRELVDELVADLGEEIADGRHAMAPREHGQLKVVAKRDAVARRRRDDLDPVVDVLEPLAGRDPVPRRPAPPRPARRRARRAVPRAAAARRGGPGPPCGRGGRARRRRRRSRRCPRARGRTRAASGTAGACRRTRARRSIRPRSAIPAASIDTRPRPGM